MYKDLKFPVLIVHRDVQADSVAGERVRGIVRELEQDGFATLCTASVREGRIVASSQHGLACVLVAAEGAGDNPRLLQDVVELIRVARAARPAAADLRPRRADHHRERPARGDGRTQPAARHPLPVRGHRALPRPPGGPRGARAIWTACCRRSSGPGAAHRRRPITPGTRPGTAAAWPPQEPGGPGLPPVLRREHPAFGPVGVGARAGLAARPHRAAGRGRAARRAQLRRRPHLLRRSTAPRRPTRSSGTPWSAATTWCWSTATATSRWCTR